MLRYLPVFLFLFAFAGLCLWATSEEVSGTDDSSPLKLIKPYLKDQTEFEHRLRAFEKLYLSLARTKYLEAKEYEQKGDAENAKTASEEAHKILFLIKDAYELGLGSFRNSAVLNNYYGEFLHDYLGLANEALKYWQQSIQLDSGYGRAHGNLGMYYFHTGMYGMGIEHMDKALELEPQNPDHLFNMVQIYLTNYVQIMEIKNWDKKKLFREAMRMSELTTKLCPNDYEILRDHAMNYFLSEDFGVPPDWGKASKAWESTRLHARTNTERFNALINEGRIYMRKGDKRRAKECLEQANTILPDNPTLKLLLEEVTK
jgi:tetratricopeptide (TPR) repeat protein